MAERRPTEHAPDESPKPADQPKLPEGHPQPAQAKQPPPRAGALPPVADQPTVATPSGRPPDRPPAPPPVEPPAHEAGVQDPAVAMGVPPDPAQQGQRRQPSQRMPEILDLRDRMDRYEQTLHQLQQTLEANQKQIAEAKNHLQVIAQHEHVDLNMLKPQ